MRAVAGQLGAFLDVLGVDRIWHGLVAWLRAGSRRREMVLLRTQRDIERIKLGTATILGPDRAVTLLATGDYVYVDPRDRGCGSNMIRHGRYEEDELRLFRAYLAPGTAVLDVGANYGYYALCAAPFVRPGGRVIAFEPNPHVHALLQASIALNGYQNVVEARCIGVSDAADRLRFVVDESSPGGAHVVLPEFPPPPQWKQTDVPVCRLDDEIPSDLVVDLIKLDVEGHEERALRGMRELVARSPNIRIFMEFIHGFLPDEDAFNRIVHLITVELGLRSNLLLLNGRTEEVDMTNLAGASCTLILSKGPLDPVPDVTVHACQLRLVAGACMLADTLVWRREDGSGQARQTICFGGHLYLPRGRYRAVVDGAFKGPFLLRLSADGEILWETRVSGAEISRRLELAVDAVRFETVLIALSGRSNEARLRSVQFWRY